MRKSNIYFLEYGNMESCGPLLQGWIYYRVNLRNPVLDQNYFDVAVINEEGTTMSLWLKKGDFKNQKVYDAIVHLSGVTYSKIEVSKPNTFYGIFKYANMNGRFRFNECEFEGERYHLAELFLYEPDGKLYVNFFSISGAVAKRIIIDHDPPDNPQRWSHVDPRA